MKKILGFAGAIALSVIPTPNFSGELEKKEIMSVTEKLLPQIGEKYYSLDKKEKKEYRKGLNKYLKEIENYSATGLSEGFSRNPDFSGLNPGCSQINGKFCDDINLWGNFQ